MGPFVAELREFIRRLKVAEEADRLLRRKIVALEQSMRDAWTEGGSRLPGADFSGVVNGCSSHGYPAASVAVKDHDTGATLATITADGSGAYSGTIALSRGSPQAFDFVATPTGADASKFAGPVTLSDVALSDGSNAVGTITLLPAAGYCCGPTSYAPGSSCCNLNVTVFGCNSVGVPGAAVTVTETATGTVLASGTTNGSGVFSQSGILLASNPTPVTVGVTSPATDRLASASFTGNLVPGNVGLSTTLALTGSGWVCNSGSWYPLPTTIHMTDSVLGGPLAMTWSGTDLRYNGNPPAAAFPGCGICPPAANAVIQYSYTPSSRQFAAFHYVGAPNNCPGTAFSGSVIPDASGTATITSSVPYAANLTTTGAANFWYCGGSVTFTITE